MRTIDFGKAAGNRPVEVAVGCIKVTIQAKLNARDLGFVLLDVAGEQIVIEVTRQPERRAEGKARIGGRERCDGTIGQIWVAGREHDCTKRRIGLVQDSTRIPLRDALGFILCVKHLEI